MFVRDLRDLTSHDGATAGGKGANLGELIRAGFTVPPGFVLTTDAYERVATAIDTRDPAGARAAFARATLPADVDAALLAAYRALGGGRVAVRSSATAEDLPEASFAGQQDTILGVAGEDALRDAVRLCWASLWNDRAVAYRTTHDVSGTVALAVVVQRMVEARTAGVLFTADPVTGRRSRAVIEAVAGLGDRLVSGQVDPDHFVADLATGVVLERHGGALADDEVRSLASVGARIEAHFGRPQDIEWAIDAANELWIVQSRDITTLYPLPPDLPDPERDLRVMLSANVAQGVFQPFTPMGVQTFRLMSSAFATLVGTPPRDIDTGAESVVRVSGLRIWIDITEALRNIATRELPLRILSVMEARSSDVAAALLRDPRLAPRPSSPLRTRLRLLRVVMRTRAPLLVLRAFLRPAAARARLLPEFDALVNTDVGPTENAAQRLAAFERMFLEIPPRLFPRLVSLAAAGFIAYNVAGRVLGRAASRDELRSVLRGLPYNPTTEMDLALWELARATRGDPAAEERGLAQFLERYGHRAVAEIDLGVPRWSEDPSHLRAAIASYRRLSDDASAPDAQFARGVREAETTIATLLSRVHGPRRLIARAMLARVRLLSGLREMPKFQIIRLFARARALLAPVGDELAAAGRIARADDLWFLTLPDVRRALAGEDMRALVAERRADYAREMRRRHVPRILLSDGTDAEAAMPSATSGGIRGTSASAGVALGVARVLLTPDGAHLLPGEVLVAPATDPGWTPLFLTASALVMEMGGMMSHGAVVAREYGIPAVVGVARATERIATGQRVRVDGSAGTVELEEPA